jgi:hypothetical protein
MHGHKHAKMPKEMKVGGTTTPDAAFPYLHVVDSARRTHGKGSTQPTLFGVLGRTKMDPYMTSLQDLVMDTKSGHSHAPVMTDRSVMHHGNTERHNVSAPPKTHIEMHRYGQIQYPGAYM